MEHEARIGYLCYKAARNALTVDEECELLALIVLDPEILELVKTEILLWEWHLVI